MNQSIIGKFVSINKLNSSKQIPFLKQAVKAKGKGKGHPRRDHEGPDLE
jgi:hypothetical protein